ncbi:hypothetical protein NQ317_010489 [Molorchus minor]|uniref:Uncharacterized protein n=1 Tax=Molorchus minor TaxID=1323400 RepID=A0ABQ9JZW7_9CUCU|nr:hypothetical protein NQ317_010489 [Molorchus minor]
MTESVNDTIIKMVKNLKSVQSEKVINFEYSPLKRSMSSSISNESIYDDPTPVKENQTRNHMHGVRKQMQLMFDEENQSLKRQQEYDKKTIDELENQLQVIRKREIDVKKDLAEANNKYGLLKIKTSQHVERLEKTLEELKEESRQMESEENSLVPSLERKISELETMLEAAEDDAEAQKKLAVELEKTFGKNALDRDLELKEQALQKAKLSIKELEYFKESMLEFQEQAKSQEHKLAHYAELQRENEALKEETTRLKEEIRNKLLLEEEVYDLKRRLTKFKAQEKKLSDLQAQESQNVMATVERLQQQELSLTSEKVELESALNSVLHEAKVAKSEVEKNHKLIAELKATGEQKQNLIHRMQKKLLLVSRERDSYRLQLDSCEKDLTMFGNITSTGGTGSNQLQAQKERVENLEKIVEGYRDMVAKLENDLQNIQPNLLSDIVPVRAEQISRLQDEVQQLKYDNEKLRERKRPTGNTA